MDNKKKKYKPPQPPVNYERNYYRFMNELYRKVRQARIAANPEYYKRKREAYIERLKKRPPSKPIGWTKAGSKKIEPFTFDPVKGMTIGQKLEFDRMSPRRREEEKIKAWAKKLRTMKDAAPAFKTRMIELDEKRERRQILIDYMMKKRYPRYLEEYLETIPEYHKGKYVLYTLNEIYPEFNFLTHNHKVDHRFLLAFFRRQAALKRSKVIVRNFERRQKLRRMGVKPRRRKRHGWIPIKRIRRIIRKTALYYNYLPRNALQGPTAIHYKLRNALIESSLSRKLRREILYSRQGWLNILLTRLGKSRSWFLHHFKRYNEYLYYLCFLGTRRGRIFRPRGFKFDIVQRITFYSAMRDLKIRLWNIERKPKFRYNYRSRSYQNKYLPFFRKRVKRIRRFIKRKGRAMTTYTWRYKKARRYFKRLWRKPITKEELPVVDLRRTKNNFFIHVRQRNRTLFVHTAGIAGKIDDKPVFVGPKRSTPFAAEVVGREVAQRLLNRGLEDVIVRYRSRHSYFVKSAVKGLRSGYVKKKNTKEGRLKRFKTNFYRQKLRIPQVRAWITLSHNGLRGKKARRM